ncbi:hypothetical protein AMTRI_Chr02g213570 [Amborella trichopoda]|uniref:Pentacotripeptide-repeat region of PRORP domain-containing protein n=1 Tax=Amborella trichopoda TaxID=13333 RepID=U5CP36_AMBTC|nr:pentatricopeptide repeat-containing protein At1g55890, mitochondrial [Amborella trichopoda]ERN14931.1 hypothetical protein AMTR_s00032p00197250 [Amborella trichopoda]|eukprot:XP_006853464.1 pentatricopeptide repeat-containing protein At1g55890, mitochondrial [Amborella trichopoda]
MYSATRCVIVPAPRSIRCLCSNVLSESEPSHSSQKKNLHELFRRPKVEEALADLFQENDLDTLVEKFKKASERYRFRCTHNIYGYTVMRLAKANKKSSIEEILEEQKKYKATATEGFLIRLISLYGKAGMFDQALNTFKEIPEFNCKWTVKSFNALLSACVNSKNCELVSVLFQELSTALSIVPDVLSYNILMFSLGKIGSLDSAFSMLEEMRQKGVDPSIVTFNTLLNAFYGEGKCEDAEKIWEIMEKRGCKPETTTYNAKIRWLVAEGRTMEANDLLGELGSKGLKPDAFSFNCVMKGFYNHGDLEEVKRIYREMRDNGCLPNRTTYEMLIRLLCKAKDLKMAAELCEEGLRAGCSIGAGIVQEVVDELIEDSKVERAKNIVELGSSKRYLRESLKMPAEEV